MTRYSSTPSTPRHSDDLSLSLSAEYHRQLALESAPVISLTSAYRPWHRTKAAARPKPNFFPFADTHKTARSA